MGSIVSVKERARKKTMVITSLGSQFMNKQRGEIVEGGNQRIVDWHGDVGAKKPRNTGRGVDRYEELVHRNRNRVQNENKNLAKRVNYEQSKPCQKQQTSRGKTVERNNGSKVTVDADLTLNPRNADDEGSQRLEVGTVVRDGQVIASTCHKEGTEWESSGAIRSKEKDLFEKLDADGRRIFEVAAEGEVEVFPDGNAPLQIIGTRQSSVLLPPEEFAPISKSSRSGTPVHNAVGNWGEGVVGTSSQALDVTGRITSRGVDTKVKSSADYYHQFAYVSSYRSPTPKPMTGSARRYHTGGCMCQSCINTRARELAAVRIQRNLRGYQARREMLRRRQSVVKIQRIYRAKIQKRLSEGLGELVKSGKDANLNTENEVELRKAAKENFEMYQEDITELKWQSQRLIEIANMGENYEPQKILLISSNIQRPEWLARITLKDVHVIMYQFSHVTIMELLKNIALSLDDYQAGSKAKRIAFVCQGGPGYMYICKGRVLTSRKLEKEPDLKEFFKELGGHISKKDPDDAKVHFIGCNVTGNKNGEVLLQGIQNTMHPARVLVESPLEVSAKGYKMLSDYFNIDLYNIWKKNRYTKIRIKGLEQ